MKTLIAVYEKLIEAHQYGAYARRFIDAAVAVQQIPAPTFAEGTRAAFVQGQFAALGLREIAVDDVQNVYGLLPGAQRGGAGVMVAAHTDTVFSAHTDLTVRHERAMIFGPGLGDNSAGAAGLIILATILVELNITPPCDLWFVATTREEGLGDLGGMRAAFERLRSRIGAVINIEGLAFGHVYNAGIAVRRFHITAATPGGHSWLHFGRPSAINAILELGARLTAMKVPETPRTTYNIGMIEGGESINSIASRAGLWLDLRSEDDALLNELVARVEGFTAALTTHETQFKIEQVGDRPAGSLAPTHPLVVGALAALESVGIRGSLESGSTDANIPLAAGVPAVTIGITRGGNAHRLDEYMEIAPIESGLRQLVTLCMAASAWMVEKGNS